MRTLRLGREFEAVFVHDAVVYLTTEDDLLACLRTAYVHCAAGGVALFAPDAIRELFRSDTDCGGHDGDDGRALRYLEWTHEAQGATYVVDYAYILRAPDQPPRVVHDRHECGLFGREVWLRLLSEAGFDHAEELPFEHSEEPSGSLVVFVARRLRR
jgi:hypothetical protein